MTDTRRKLPSVNSLLESEAVIALLQTNPRSVVVNAVRAAVDRARATADSPTSESEWISLIRAELSRTIRPTLQRVINATGVVLHTNLGRAPLAKAALDAIALVGSGYSNLEYDLEAGRRGSRYSHCVSLLTELTGAEDAIVVNNCAAALVLALSTLAGGKDAIISRGELVEIGGSFRIPDIMRASGATLLEVGTTNRTHLDDYLRAVSANTGAFVKVHRSNFAVTGFVADVSIDSLAPVGAERGIPVIFDLGSGLLISLESIGLSGEPLASDAVRAGATLVLMSGDKLLGGPQAGIIVGRASAIAQLKINPLARAMRVDKLTIAALSATLSLYRDPAIAMSEIPTLGMLAASPASLQTRAEHIAAILGKSGIRCEIVATMSSVGAGAFPTAQLESRAISLSGNPTDLERKLRENEIPVIGRISNDRLLLDLRSVLPDEDSLLATAIQSAVA